MQHMEALRRANETRSWLAEHKRSARSGDLEVWCALLQSGDERLKSVALIDFLQWLPGVGKTRARKIINDTFPWPTPRTEMRRVATIDLPTAMRISREARLNVRHVHLERFAAV